jgi:ATP/maltotriose-dependent transcriptional regulator MalT
VSGELEEARQAFGQESWVHAYEGLARAAGLQPLDAEDLERLAVAAYFVGRDDEAMQAWERAHQVWSRLSEPDRAARAAFWLAFGLLLGGEGSRANGWFNRARRLVEGLGADCPAHGYLAVPEAMEALERGDDGEAAALYLRAFELAERFDDTDLKAIALLGRGEVAVARGDTHEGLALLDEAMVAATTGEVSPLTVGILYCAVIDACMQAFDLRRAAEWTEALTRWSGGEAEVVPFRGTCLVHRSQILQAHGEWGEALDEATSAEDHLGRSRHPATGVACYQRGELHRLLGDLDAAERAYRQASRHGREPSPGFALLCLAEGRTEAAAVAVRRMLDEATGRSARLAVLPVFVEVMLACGDVAAAERAGAELAALASEVGSPLVDALSAHATGSVLLAEGDPSGASRTLRRACQIWRDQGMPYECARSQELVGRSCQLLGDDETGDLELGAAQDAFEALGATVDATRVATHRAGVVGPAPGSTGTPLTARECEVLRLVGAGSTNREIGATLAISEHTVARHVQNIFTKLGVSSRAAATAYAYEHGIV